MKNGKNWTQNLVTLMWRLGKQGQICFAEFLEIISSFYAQNSCTDRVDILLCFERNKTGVFRQNVALWPFRSDPLLATSTPRLRPRRVLEIYGLQVRPWNKILFKIDFVIQRINSTTWNGDDVPWRCNCFQCCCCWRFCKNNKLQQLLILHCCWWCCTVHSRFPD